jgi:tetratricopeptide (TPR) repeat protein
VSSLLDNLSDPPPRRLDDTDRERIEAVSRVVLEVLADWQGRKAKPSGALTRAIDWVSSHWVVVAFSTSAVVLFLAWAIYDVSLLRPLEELKYRQDTDRIQAEQREFAKRMVSRRLTLGKSLLDVGEYEGARHEFDAVQKQEPTNATAQLGLLKAQIYAAMQGEYNPAVIERRIRLILDENQNDAHALVFLGDLYAALDPDRAIEHYERARRLGPDLASAHFGLGVLYHKKGKLQLAREHLQEATRISAWNPRYLNNLANIYAETEEADKAVQVYELALRLDPEFLLPYLELAEVQRRRGRLAEAVAVHQELIRLLSSQTVVSLPKNSGTWYFQAGEAPVYLVELPAKHCYAYYSLSVSLHLFGRTREAQAYVQKARALRTPDEPSIRALVAHDLRRLKAKHSSWARTAQNFEASYLGR